MKKHDFARDLVCLVQEVASLDQSVASKIDKELRSRYGGSTVRIEPVPAITYEDVVALQRKGKTIKVISNETGLSRSTIYRRLYSKSVKRST